jgi:hypothetical protein
MNCVVLQLESPLHVHHSMSQGRDLPIEGSRSIPRAEAISNVIKSVITPVIPCGPYGKGLFRTAKNGSGPEITNILTIVVGTGVSLTLPLVLAATSDSAFDGAAIGFI